MTVAFVTLGCKVNQVDSDALRQRTTATGYSCVAPEAAPDIIVLNSCAVTAESERKTRQKLRHFRSVYPLCILVLTGCAVQVSANAAAAYPEADIVLGHQDANRLTQCIDEFIVSRSKSLNVSPHYCGEVFDDIFPGESDTHTRANLKIEDGCDRFCSYCIIPHARGCVRSKPLDALRRDIEMLAAQGFQEVVLVGINLGAYGSDIGCGLSDAVALFDEFSAIKRVRLGSLEPDCLTEEMLQSLSRCKSLCPHFHISLQSGRDSVLKRMNRRYTTEQYFNIVKRLRSLFLDAAITTDIMVGFPGESDEAFTESLAFAQQIGFAKMHVFPYSARPGTPAADFPDQIAKAEKLERVQKMLSLADELNQSFLAAQCGKTLEVLLEEPHPDGGMHGYSANYVRVAVPGALTRNQIVPVRINAVKGDYCFGEVLR